MDVAKDLLGGVKEALTVRRVYGEPYERDGVTVIPVAKLIGGGGGGGGQGPGGEDGEGGGFGMSARPAGVYVIAGDKVRWEPALDVNRIVLGAQVVAVLSMLIIRRVLGARSSSAAASEPRHWSTRFRS